MRRRLNGEAAHQRTHNNNITSTGLCSRLMTRPNSAVMILLSGALVMTGLSRLAYCDRTNRCQSSLPGMVAVSVRVKCVAGL